jgi:hypothetical protein
MATAFLTPVMFSISGSNFLTATEVHGDNAGARDDVFTEFLQVARLRLASANSCRERRRVSVICLMEVKAPPFLLGEGGFIFKDNGGDGGTQRPRKDPFGHFGPQDQIILGDGLTVDPLLTDKRPMISWASSLPTYWPRMSSICRMV